MYLITLHFKFENFSLCNSKSITTQRKFERCKHDFREAAIATRTLIQSIVFIYIKF